MSINEKSDKEINQVEGILQKKDDPVYNVRVSMTEIIEKNKEANKNHDNFMCTVIKNALDCEVNRFGKLTENLEKAYEGLKVEVFYLKKSLNDKDKLINFLESKIKEIEKK